MTRTADNCVLEGAVPSRWIDIIALWGGRLNWNGTVKTRKRFSKGRLGLSSRVKSCFATFPETANGQQVAEALKGINSPRWG